MCSTRLFMIVLQFLPLLCSFWREKPARKVFCKRKNPSFVLSIRLLSLDWSWGKFFPQVPVIPFRIKGVIVKGGNIRSNQGCVYTFEGCVFVCSRGECVIAVLNGQKCLHTFGWWMLKGVITSLDDKRCDNIIRWSMVCYLWIVKVWLPVLIVDRQKHDCTFGHSKLNHSFGCWSKVQFYLFKEKVSVHFEAKVR